MLHFQAQVRQIGQTVVTSGALPNQIRMLSQTGIRPGQTTITRHSAPVRIQGPISTTTGPRLLNASVSQIRPGTTIVQTNSLQQNQSSIAQQHLQQQTQSTPPALQPVSVNNNQNVLIPAAQVIFCFCRSV